MFNCARCHEQVAVCTRCDRGQRYCSTRCSRQQRQWDVREAGRRYQRTPRGAANNAARQKRWRWRSAPSVTHQGSPSQAGVRQEAPVSRDPKEVCHATPSREPVAGVVIIEPVPPRRCDFCGRPCGSYSRLATLSAAAHRGRWRVVRRV